MGCRTYHIPYTGKPETEFKFRLNNNRKYVNRQNANTCRSALQIA